MTGRNPFERENPAQGVEKAQPQPRCESVRNQNTLAGPVRLAGSRHRSEVSGRLPHRIHGPLETLRAIRMSERQIGRIRAMCLSICPLGDPMHTIRGRSGLVSNESAHATNREQYRCDERPSCQSGRRLTSCVNCRICARHVIPLSFSGYPRIRVQQHGARLGLMQDRDS